MKKTLHALLYWVILVSVHTVNAQSLGRVGSPVDIVTTPTGGTVLMGGGSGH
jgi:hypothetical protein